MHHNYQLSTQSTCVTVYEWTVLTEFGLHPWLVTMPFTAGAAVTSTVRPIKYHSRKLAALSPVAAPEGAPSVAPAVAPMAKRPILKKPPPPAAATTTGTGSDY